MPTQYSRHWGAANSVTEIAPGIKFFSTPSHGGYELTKEKLQEMPQHLKDCSFTKDNCFEEDCSWCAVVLAFPQHFTPQDIANATATYEAHYRKDK